MVEVRRPRRPSAIKAKPARLKRTPKPKAEGYGWNPLLDYFRSPETFSTQGLLHELKNLQEDDRNVLWYPSSGMDLTDINVMEEGYFIWKITPLIFIHTDPLEYPDAANGAKSEVLLFNDKWQAILQKISLYGESKWLFQIKIENYEFLPWLLRSGIRVPFLYTACDGVTTGGPPSGKFPITTFYLTRFYQVLGIEYHITEYSREFYEEHSLHILKNLKAEVPRLEECYPEIRQIKTPTFPESFISLKESPIKLLFTHQGNQLVVRYCNT